MPGTVLVKLPRNHGHILVFTSTAFDPVVYSVLEIFLVFNHHVFLVVLSLFFFSFFFKSVFEFLCCTVSAWISQNSIFFSLMSFLYCFRIQSVSHIALNCFVSLTFDSSPFFSLFHDLHTFEEFRIPFWSSFDSMRFPWTISSTSPSYLMASILFSTKLKPKSFILSCLQNSSTCSEVYQTADV